MPLLYPTGNFALSSTILMILFSLIFITITMTSLYLIKSYRLRNLNKGSHGGIKHKSTTPFFRNPKTLYESLSLREDINMVELPIAKGRTYNQGFKNSHSTHREKKSLSKI